MPKKKILVVEDDEKFREALVHFLEEENFKVFSAVNGKTAKEIISSGELDVILADIQMPYLTGIELLEWVNENKPTPMVLMTGFSNLLETRSAHEKGARGFLAKPFNNTELLEALAEIVGDYKAPVEADPEVELPKYCKVPINEFVSKPQIDFDVYVKLTEKKYVKIGHAGSNLPVDRLTEYREKGVEYLYILSEDFPKLLDFNLDMMKVIRNNPKVSPEKKANFMRYTGELLLEKCFVEGIDKEAWHDANTFLGQCVSSIVDTKENYDLISALNTHSNSVYAHSVGVALYAIMIARKMEFESSTTFYKLSMAGLFHDIGKKEIPQEIIDKPRPLLSQKERNILESHPSRSREILLEISGIPEDVIEMVYQHHEDPIGTGFPRRLTKQKLHPLTPILYTANRFTELTVNPNKNKRKNPEGAIYHLKLDEDKLDKKVMQALDSLVANRVKDNGQSA